MLAQRVRHILVLLETGPLRCSHIYHRRNSLGSVEGSEEALSFVSQHSQWGQHSTVNYFIQFPTTAFKRPYDHTHTQMKTCHIRVLSKCPLNLRRIWGEFFQKTAIVSKINMCQQIQYVLHFEEDEQLLSFIRKTHILSRGRIY